MIEIGKPSRYEKTCFSCFECNDTVKEITIKTDNGFTFPVAVNLCEKCRQELVNKILHIEEERQAFIKRKKGESND